MNSSPTRYSSPALANKIAKNYGTSAKKVKVSMVGAEDISKLLSKVRKAQAKAGKHPIQLD